jgi:FtsH-binding integral membrane protein
MDSQNQHSNSTDLSLIQPVEQTQVKNFMANVFAYMFMALGISALFAYLFSTNLELLQYLVSSTGRGLNALCYIFMFAPLGFVLLMSFGYSRLSAPVLVFLFVYIGSLALALDLFY